MNYLTSLNPEQRAAVTAPLGPVLVRAGAGSGKTRVLTLRIAYLIEQHSAPPGSILALTFTNKAAKEMRDRLRKQLGNRTRGLTTGTFHAVCGKLLRAEIAGRIGHYTADFTIYGADEQLQLATAALDAAKERPPQLLEPNDLIRLISRNKRRLLSPRMAPMVKHAVQKKLVYEGAAARYRTLMMKTRDPARRQMLAEMIARELESVKRRGLYVVPMPGRRLGEAGTL